MATESTNYAVFAVLRKKYVYGLKGQEGLGASSAGQSQKSRKSVEKKVYP